MKVDPDKPPVTGAGLNWSHLLKTQAWLVVIITVVGTGLGVVYALLKPRTYETSFLVSVGIVGDVWLHSPMQVEERCKSRWFLGRLAQRLADRYQVGELEEMIEPELVLTPTNGLTRDVRITVTAHDADDCYKIATELGKMLGEDDNPMYDTTYELIKAYLDDLQVVIDSIHAAAREGKSDALVPGAVPEILAVPPDNRTVYEGGPQVFRLFSANRGYTDNPYLLSSIALLEQVYVDAYLKIKSPIYSQPTMVVIPPSRPTTPADGGTFKIVLACLFISLTLGVVAAVVSYRYRRPRP